MWLTVGVIDWKWQGVAVREVTQYRSLDWQKCPITSCPVLTSGYSANIELGHIFGAKRGRAALEAHRVSWKIYT